MTITNNYGHVTTDFNGKVIPRAEYSKKTATGLIVRFDQAGSLVRCSVPQEGNKWIR